MTVYTFNSTGAGYLKQTVWVNKRICYVCVFFAPSDLSQHMCKSNWGAHSTKRYQVLSLTMPIRLFWGWVFPYISLQLISVSTSIYGTWNVWWSGVKSKTNMKAPRMDHECKPFPNTLRVSVSTYKHLPRRPLRGANTYSRNLGILED